MSPCAENLNLMLRKTAIRKSPAGFFAHLPFSHLAQAQAFATSVAAAINPKINFNHTVVRPPNEADGNLVVTQTALAHCQMAGQDGENDSDDILAQGRIDFCVGIA